MREPIKLLDAVKITKLWLAAGGRPYVELGALEPLLWRDGRYGPGDLVSALSDVGVEVTMTSNASLLEKHAKSLHRLSRLRVSWHTTNEQLFSEISGGSSYTSFVRGIESGLEAKLPISFNRVLLKGHTSDLGHHLDLIRKYETRLKVYGLLWTPDIGNRYADLYQPVFDIVDLEIKPRAIKVERIHKEMARDRLRYWLSSQAWVEAKATEQVDRSVEPCLSCEHKEGCFEAIGDYLRVEPELDIFFCYLRRDWGFSARGMNPGEFQAAIAKRLGEISKVDPFLRSAALRMIVVPQCNFNCFIPGTNTSWCHKNSGNYVFPKRTNSRLPVAQ